MRRGWLLVLAIILLLLLAAASYLASGYFGEPEKVTLARDAALLRLLGEAPSDARQVILAPTFGPLVRSLANHPVTSSAMQRFVRARELKLAALLIGRSPVVAWEKDDAVSIIADISGLRRALILSVARIGSPLPVGRRGAYLTFGADSSTGGGAIASELTEVSGEMFIVHRSGKDRYPPLRRPSISAISLHPSHALVSSLGAAEDLAVAAPQFQFETSSEAMLSIVFWRPHPSLEELDRFLPMNLERIAANGAVLNLYDIEDGGLLPRPRGLLVVPQTAEALEAAAALFNPSAFPQLLDEGEPPSSRMIGSIKVDRVRRLGTTFEVARGDGKILFGFDGTSLERYLHGGKRPAKGEASASWTVAGDVARLRPVVARLKDHRGLKFIAPKVSRSFKQASSLLELLPPSATISATKKRSGTLDLVELTIATTK